MSIPGFASAQAAWENANPYDSDCTCLEDDMFVCPECGEASDVPGQCKDDGADLEQPTDDARREDCPAESCPRHGYTDQDAADDAREHDYESRMGY